MVNQYTIAKIEQHMAQLAHARAFLFEYMLNIRTLAKQLLFNATQS